jgi:predicted acylesterase/phospholipase RssA
MSRALVISGGGSKGAFAVGIVKRLFEQYPNLEFDMFVGTSTGSLIVPLVAMNEMALLEQIYTTRTTQDIVLQNRLGDRITDDSIFDATPLWNTLGANYTDARCATILNAGKKLYINTTCMQSGELVVFTTDQAPINPKNYQIRSMVDANHFRRAVMASACQPVFMQPITVNRDIPGEPNPTFQFVDGGVKQYVGVEIAIDNGATEIFTILLSPETDAVDNISYGDLFSILQKTIGIFSDGVAADDMLIPRRYNEALVYIDAVKTKMKQSGLASDTVDEFFNIPALSSPYQDKAPIKFFTFEPDAPLGGGPGGLTFDPAEMTGMLQKGVAAANAFINSINPADITWN